MCFEGVLFSEDGIECYCNIFIDFEFIEGDVGKYFCICLREKLKIENGVCVFGFVICGKDVIVDGNDCNCKVFGVLYYFVD